MARRRLSFRPVSRSGAGVRGSARLLGRAAAPPLTDVPIGASVIATSFDVISFIGDHTPGKMSSTKRPRSFSSSGLWSPSLRSSPVCSTAGARSEAGTQLRRTINARALLLVLMAALVLDDLGLRWFCYRGLAGPTSSCTVRRSTCSPASPAWRRRCHRAGTGVRRGRLRRLMTTTADGLGAGLVDQLMSEAALSMSPARGSSIHP